MRKIVIYALVCVLAFAASGCKKQKAGGPVVLELWTQEDPNRQKMEEEFAKEYMAANPNVTINYNVHPSTKIQDLISTAYASKQGPSIWNMELQKAYPLFMQGLVAPIPVKELGLKNEQELSEQYLPRMLDPVTDADGMLFGKKGKIYGLPLEMTNYCMYLNKKIFRDAGLNPDIDYPKTWEDVMAVSEKITKRNGDIVTRRGFDFRYGDYLISWVPMVEQAGGKVISDDGKEAIVNEAAWIKVLTFMEAWGPQGKNLGSPAMTAARRQFDNNKDEVAMHLSGLYQEARMLSANADFYNSDDWMVIPYPVFSGGEHIANTYYFHYYMVNSQIPEDAQIEAWKFIYFMLGHGNDYLEKTALIQPTKAVMEGDVFTAMPYSSVFKDDLDYAHVVYHSGFSYKINELIETAIVNVMSTKTTPKQAFDTLKKDAQAVLNENLTY
ncbi:MAG: ABC transporter substrate-binding protein [Termitinemataceae bacterium]|nr:MAG: ABC transporter substrate-binding protein [Termitinemataceae bacterium]